MFALVIPAQNPGVSVVTLLLLMSTAAVLAWGFGMVAARLTGAK